MNFKKKIPRLLRIIILLIILLVLILIAWYFIFLKINGLIEPTHNMISRIESTGRDATCADLIGKWLILGEAKTWEFGEIEVRTVEINDVPKLIRDGTFVEEPAFFEGYGIEHPYTCDDSTRTAKIPFLDTCAPPNIATCCLTTRLGAISDDRMMIYTGDTDAKDVYVMERK